MSTKHHPGAFDQLMEQLTRMPGIGKRSAERIAFHLLREPQQAALDLARAIERFRTDLKACRFCGHVTESDPCPICCDQRRDRSRILVVEQSTDVVTFEQTGVYRGLYHVLMGRLAPMEGIGAAELNIDPLLRRLESAEVKEVILGMNATLEGDGTALYLQEQLAARQVAVTRLARGMPTGSTLGGVSKAVLVDAVHGRQPLSF